MFDYSILRDTLLKKGLTFDDLCEGTGLREGVIKQKLNGSENISISMLDRICTYLKCQPSEVIRWVEGEPKKAEKVKVDWVKIEKMCRQDGYTLEDLAEDCKLSRTTFRKAKKRNSAMKQWTFKLVCSKLKCDPGFIRIK